MSADEYASKELQLWRKAEAAMDIEAIKTHELDMLALGNTFVMKSHKGEQVIEKSETDAVSSSTSEVCCRKTRRKFSNPLSKVTKNLWMMERVRGKS